MASVCFVKLLGLVHTEKAGFNSQAHRERKQEYVYEHKVGSASVNAMTFDGHWVSQTNCESWSALQAYSENVNVPLGSFIKRLPMGEYIHIHICMYMYIGMCIYKIVKDFEFNLANWLREWSWQRLVLKIKVLDRTVRIHSANCQYSWILFMIHFMLIHLIGRKFLYKQHFENISWCFYDTLYKRIIHTCGAWIGYISTYLLHFVCVYTCVPRQLNPRMRINILELRIANFLWKFPSSFQQWLQQVL